MRLFTFLFSLRLLLSELDDTDSLLLPPVSPPVLLSALRSSELKLSSSEEPRLPPCFSRPLSRLRFLFSRPLSLLLPPEAFLPLLASSLFLLSFLVVTALSLLPFLFLALLAGSAPG